MADMIRNLWSIDVPRGHQKKRRNLVWSPPVVGVIKVNVNGSFLGGSDRWGIGVSLGI